MDDKLKEKANPFYRQEVFNSEDLKRSIATWYDRLRFIFRPTHVQIFCEENKVVHFKQNGAGEILITKVEEFEV